MNEILQKRIEEVAKDIAELCSDCDLHCKGPNPCIPKILYQKLIEISTFALQNQWISVEEALPDKKHDVLVAILNTKTNTYFFGFDAIVDDSVFLRDKNGFPIEKDYHKITHWMEISQPKGGDE